MKTTKHPYTSYTLTLSIGFPGADQEEEYDVRDEYDEESWDNKSEKERKLILTEATKYFALEHIEFSYRPNT